MKPEEAIRAIEVLRDIDINYPPTQQDVADTEGAIELAIEALEKQSQLEYIRFIVENTHKTSMSDSLAMQALRDHFKRGKE